MGLIYKEFPCGCKVYLCTFGYWAGGDAIEKAEDSTCDKDEEHIQATYDECNEKTIPELFFECEGWKTPGVSDDDANSDRSIREYNLIRLCKYRGVDIDRLLPDTVDDAMELMPNTLIPIIEWTESQRNLKLNSNYRESREVFTKKIEYLSRFKGKDLISLNIHRKDKVARVVKMLEEDARIVQHQETRCAIIQRAITMLNGVETTPRNGLVVYCGNITNQNGTVKEINEMIEPPFWLDNSLYLMDNRFHTEVVEEMLKSMMTY